MTIRSALRRGIRPSRSHRTRVLWAKSLLNAALFFRGLAAGFALVDRPAAAGEASLPALVRNGLAPALAGVRSSSNVYLRQRPGEVWRLVRRAGRSSLEPGAVKDPDFVFRFSPGSARRLASVRGGFADFAVELFSLFDEVDELRVDFRVVAPLRRLVARGYLKLLLDAGPKLAAYGAGKGLRGLRDLRALIARSRARTPFEWESKSPR